MSATAPSDGVYFIQNVGTGTVLDLTNGSSANSTKVQGYEKRELSDEWVPAQLWVITKAEDDSVYKIENANSRTIMDLTASNPANGTPIIGYQSNGNPNQRWAILPASDGTAYVIKNEATGTYVDLYEGGSANGTAVNGWAGSGVTTTNTHQLWKLISA